MLMFVLVVKFVHMMLIVKFWNISLLYIQQSIWSCWWLVHIYYDLLLIYFPTVYIESIPFVVVATVAPVMSAGCITAMNKNIHEMILLFPTLYLFQLGLDLV